MIRIATRRSPLARWQAEHVAGLLRAREPSLEVALHEVVTQGDKILNIPLAKVGGKGLFVKEIEEALLAGRAELAVHSMKDLPTVLEEALEVTAVPPREDPRDALCTRDGRGLDALLKGARVGTSSLRRGAQLKALRPDLEVVSVRGNVETRLRKLEEGLDAVLLALAGLRRLGLEGRVAQVMEPELMLPAVAQGALALESRRDDAATRARLAPLDHPLTRRCTSAERALLRRLEGGCQVPIAAHAVEERGSLRLRALVASLDGTEVVRGERSGPASEAERLGETLGEELLSRGAGRILKALQGHAPEVPQP
jgi:hydroxymethylbilane synthase